MKKFRKGDVIALKSNPGFIYVVTEKEDDSKVWLGKLHPDHERYDIIAAFGSDMDCVLGDQPENWRVVKSAPSEKDKRIEELEKIVEDSQQQRAKMIESAKNEQYEHEMKMLDAGYVSLSVLRSNILRDIHYSHDGMSPYGLARLELMRRHRPSRDGDYINEFLKRLTAPN